MAAHPLTSVDVDADLLAQARDALGVEATADTEIVERALRAYLGRLALDAAQTASELDEDEALRLAYEELHALRRERHRAA